MIGPGGLHDRIVHAAGGDVLPHEGTDQRLCMAPAGEAVVLWVREMRN